QPDAARDATAQHGVVRTAAHSIPSYALQWRNAGRASLWTRELYGMGAGVNVGRVTNGAASDSAEGLFRGLCRHRLQGFEVGELPDCTMGVAIDALCTTACRSQHGLGDHFGRNGAPGLARPGQQRIDQWRNQSPPAPPATALVCASLTRDRA